jgi:malate dehydrogenase (oxaloacetate-decarboxylating)
VFLDVNYPEDIESRMLHYGEWDDIDYIVVTDSEAILGIGDQGTGGIGISIAKLALMTICGGVHPNRVIPVCLDVGTNNEEKLNDPLYLGNRMRRVEGARYDELVDNFIQTVKRVYPLAVVHFEDFGVKNAYRILQKYRDELPCFNDDIQGTGAVTLSAINAAMKSIGSDVSEAKILIYGAGSAGVVSINLCIFLPADVF